MGPRFSCQGFAAFVDVGEVANPLRQRARLGRRTKVDCAFRATASLTLDLAEVTREVQLLVISEFLTAEHDNRLFIDDRFQRLDRLRRQRLAAVDPVDHRRKRCADWFY